MRLTLSASASACAPSVMIPLQARLVLEFRESPRAYSETQEVTYVMVFSDVLTFSNSAMAHAPLRKILFPESLRRHAVSDHAKCVCGGGILEKVLDGVQSAVAFERLDKSTCTISLNVVAIQTVTSA